MVAIVRVDAELVEKLLAGSEATLDLEDGTILIDGNRHVLPEVPNFAKEIIDAGGIVPYVREHGRFPNS